MFERFGRSARVTVVLAQEEARELGAEEIRPEHLLVGVLQSAGRGLAALLGAHGLTVDAVRGRLESADDSEDAQFDDDAEALRRIGIDLYAIRAKMAEAFGRDAWDNALNKSGRRRRRYGHIPFTKASKKALELALREAVAHKDSTILCEHLVLGILRGGDPVAVGLITEHVDTGRLRTEIIGSLDAAA
ncbi:Clp amino terminal domain-containing protein, pathogenicity island component [Mycolicibacterium rutilum]|uniref:Clp amino terminal domain-containing protein, pathogenicity island component n=1 Tax=Mycolicibacterium rutilum TaxID=370526 RepID=A0A1H6IMB0_MYCRU|nr:Clp protease N-terminal domain-containing protein [Mycolicibacterium rutilum]SEH49137.1 Clp amino terminal domain-containing protein, pathogenicity island component [Mycolicibacterium rutilum]